MSIGVQALGEAHRKPATRLAPRRFTRRLVSQSCRQVAKMRALTYSPQLHSAAQRDQLPTHHGSKRRMTAMSRVAAWKVAEPS